MSWMTASASACFNKTEAGGQSCRHNATIGSSQSACETQRMAINEERRETLIDTKLLEARIAASGKSLGHIAKACGMTTQTLRLKRIGRIPFNTDEVQALCTELGITKLTDKERIFFAPNVDKFSTTK